MVDATIVPVPKQRNSRDENDDVKAGKTPEAWEKNPAKNRQKDKDARWTKKHGKSFYGYKNHVNADFTIKTKGRTRGQWQNETFPARRA
jgi:hypothetical protein